jgi:hypothetical protein
MSIRLTDATLDGPVIRAAIPCAVAAIVVIVVVVVAVANPKRSSRNRAAERDRSDYAKRCGNFRKGSHVRSSYLLKADNAEPGRWVPA